MEEIANTPPLKEAAELNVNLWIGDSYAAQLAAAEREGDLGALTCLRGHAAVGRGLDVAKLSWTLARRAALTREWQVFLHKNPVLLLPVSGELPFPDQLDLQGEEAWHRVWRAQTPMIGIPFMGLPGLVVSTGMVGQVPVGVQLVAGALPRGASPARGRSDRSRRRATVSDRPGRDEVGEAERWP